jgi:hypothetical protein
MASNLLDEQLADLLAPSWSPVVKDAAAEAQQNEECK